MTGLESITSVTLGALSLLGGCGWFVSGRKHRQEVERLKGDNRMQDLMLAQKYVEEFEKNIAEPLRQEVRELREQVNMLKDELERVKRFACYCADCPARIGVRSRQEGQ